MSSDERPDITEFLQAQRDALRARLAKVEKERDHWRVEAARVRGSGLTAAGFDLFKRATEAEARLARYEEALRWYAQGAPVIGYDHGDRAREALGGADGKGEGT